MPNYSGKKYLEPNSLVERFSVSHMQNLFIIIILNLFLEGIVSKRFSNQFEIVLGSCLVEQFLVLNIFDFVNSFNFPSLSLPWTGSS